VWLEELIKKLIFTLEEVQECFDNESRANYWIKRSIKKKQLQKVRNGLYALVNPVTEKAYADKLVIGSNIFDSGYLTYHSALEYHGLANQDYEKVYVASQKRFDTFTHEGISFERTKDPIEKGVDTIKSPHIIRVTDLERTVVDCIDNIERAGGVEQLVIALFHIKKLDETKLLEYLTLYNKNILWQKTAYLLENFNQILRLPKEFFAECKKGVSKRIIYFLNDGTFGDAVYNDTWNIIAPRTFSFRTGRYFFDTYV